MTTWATIFRRHLAGIDPNYQTLAKEFSWDQMDEVCGIAGAIWYGQLPWFQPETIEDAITLAITQVYETIHPEIAALREIPRTIH